MSAETVTVQETVAAPPEVVYDLVSDVTRMGEWSPETTSCRWLGGATGPAVGARFVGSNKHGWRRWATFCTVTEATRGEAFAFSVRFTGIPIADWRYAFAPDGDGCVVTETWVARWPAWMRVAAVPVMGISDRAAHNRAGMVATLRALKAAAEGLPVG